MGKCIITEGTNIGYKSSILKNGEKNREKLNKDERLFLAKENQLCRKA